MNISVLRWIGMWTAVGVLALAGTAHPQSPDDGALQKVRLQLTWKHQFQFAGYYAAIARGYYRDEGIEVEVLEAVEGEPPAEAVFEGRAEFGVSTSDIVLDRTKGRPAVVLAPIFQHSAQVIVASKESDIIHVQDLVGKRIMLEPHAADLTTYMADEGVTPGRYEVVPHSFDIRDLAAGNVDALSAYLTDEPFVLQEAGFSYTVISPLAGGVDFYGDNLFTTQGLIERDPDLVARFLRASLRGWRYAMANPEEMVDLIYTEYSTRHSRDHLRFEASQMRRHIMPDVVEIGYSNRGRWENIVDTYKRAGLVPEDTGLDGLLYEDYLHTAQPFPWTIVAFFSVVTIVVGGVAFFFYRVSGRLKESEAKFRTLAETTNSGIFVLQGTRFVLANPAMVEVSGYSKEEICGMEQMEIVHPDHRAMVMERALARQRGEPVPPRYEIKIVTKAGEERWIDVSASSTMFDGMPATIGAFLDITENKNLENELRESNATKDKFFSIIAHDLKSPFNGILGISQLLLEDMKAMQPDVLEESLRLLHSSAESAYMLLENLLEWARMQQGMIAFNPDRRHLKPHVDEALALFREQMHTKDISQTNLVADDVQVYADPNMLDTIVRNLVSNAVKFAPYGGWVKIESARRNGVEQISVSDNGAGMSSETVGRLFKLGETPSTRGTANEVGTGLGLLLCRDFVTRHGGSIWASSEPGKGSTFSFSLPSNAPKAASASSSGPAA